MTRFGLGGSQIRTGQEERRERGRSVTMIPRVLLLQITRKSVRTSLLGARHLGFFGHEEEVARIQICVSLQFPLVMSNSITTSIFSLYPVVVYV